MNFPLLSVVIPTHNRPHFLSRAINSALNSAPDNEAEIIVVPNGSDLSWQYIASEFASKKRVSWHPIKEANANLARNHGTSLAKGKYIRYLDDDDYFYSAVALEQVLNMERSGSEISQGGVAFVENSGSILRTVTPEAGRDFTIAMLSSNRITLPCAFLYLREAIIDSRWEKDRKVSQDVAFTLSLVRDYDFSVTYFGETVAAWTQHTGSRISTKVNFDQHLQEWAEILLDTTSGLKTRHALTRDRRDAVAEGLWECIHKGFPKSPLYWSKVISKVFALSPHSRPNDKHYNTLPLSLLSPVILEWIMLPHRFSRIYMKKFFSSKENNGN